MKTRVEHLEIKVSNIATEVIRLAEVQAPMKLKLDGLHDKKGEDNNRLQAFSSMLEIFKDNQDNFANNLRDEHSRFTKSFGDEHNRFTTMFRDEMKIISANLAQLMRWQYMITGGGVVIGAILVALFKYLI